jgi:hypothetical protein
MSSISQIINHINDADFHKAFLALDELKIQNPQLSSMKREYISGKYGYDFADRFLTFVSSLNKPLESLQSTNYKTVINQYGDKSVHIEKNGGDIVIN